MVQAWRPSFPPSNRRQRLSSRLASRRAWRSHWSASLSASQSGAATGTQLTPTHPGGGMPEEPGASSPASRMVPGRASLQTARCKGGDGGAGQGSPPNFQRPFTPRCPRPLPSGTARVVATQRPRRHHSAPDLGGLPICTLQVATSRAQLSTPLPALLCSGRGRSWSSRSASVATRWAGPREAWPADEALLACTWYGPDRAWPRPRRRK